MIIGIVITLYLAAGFYVASYVDKNKFFETIIIQSPEGFIIHCFVWLPYWILFLIGWLIYAAHDFIDAYRDSYKQ